MTSLNYATTTIIIIIIITKCNVHLTAHCLSLLYTVFALPWGFILILLSLLIFYLLLLLILYHYFLHWSYLKILAIYLIHSQSSWLGML